MATSTDRTVETVKIKTPSGDIKIIDTVFFSRSGVLLFGENNYTQLKSILTEKGQDFYEVFYNIVEAKNNDGSNKLNKATFSTDLVRKLLNMYVPKNSLVYDSFMGTGTTALGCIEQNINFIGSELSKEQCDFANSKIKNRLSQQKMF